MSEKSKKSAKQIGTKYATVMANYTRIALLASCYTIFAIPIAYQYLQNISPDWYKKKEEEDNNE